MRTIWCALAGALFLLAVIAARPALAVQGTTCLPTSGTVSGVDFATRVNSALATLLSNSSGTNVPKTDCSGATIAGQYWFDTSVSGLPKIRITDGTNGSNLPVATLDTVNHVLMPVVGGGVTTLASAATTDICSKPHSYLSITGSASIASFGGTACQIGQEKTVTFQATLTLLYGATSIVLPTQANVVAQAGDVARLIYLGGGVWNVVAYTRADGRPLTVTIVPPVHYAGQVLMMRGTTCPDGSLPEDGRTLSRITYTALYAYLGTKWGAGDGTTTFNIPNSGGQFDRGWMQDQTVDAGRIFGTSQLDQLQDHVHSVQKTINGYFNGVQGGGTNTGARDDISRNTSGASGTSVRAGTETRPTNITALHCIFTDNS